MRRKGGGISPLQSPTEQGPKTDFFGDPLVSPRAATGSATTKNVKTMENYFPKSPKKKDATTEEKEEAPSKASKPLAASQPMYKKITPVQTSKPKVMVSSTTKKVGLGAKKVGSGGGGLGLGAKKLNAKVDDRLFDQAPGEDVPVNNTSSSNPVSPRSGGVSPRDSSGHVALPPKSNRFAYSEDGFGNASKKNETTTTTNRNEDGPKYTMGGLESVPMNSRRGASGHVTLDRNAGKKTNIDTRNFGGGSNASSSASRPPSGNNNSSRSAFGASPSTGIAKVVVALDETHRRLHPRARTQPPRARRTITITTPPSDSRAPSPSPRMRLAAAAEAATEQTITTMVLDGTRTDTPARVGLEVRIFEEARRVREATTWTSPRAI